MGFGPDFTHKRVLGDDAVAIDENLGFAPRRPSHHQWYEPFGYAVSVGGP